MFVIVDKKKIFKVINIIPVSIDKPSKGILAYSLCGEFCEFSVSAERCVEVDNEYPIILNVYGILKAKQYLISKGLIEIGD